MKANQAQTTSTMTKIKTYCQKFKKPVQVAGELLVGIMCFAFPYYCGAIYEGYIMQTNTKGMSDYAIIHLDKSIDFVYAIAAVATVELVLLMLKQLVRTLDWHWHLPKIFKTKTSSGHYVRHTIWQIIKNILSTIVALIALIIPYSVASEYESYIMHLNVVGQSKVLISHLSKTVYFSYVLAAVVTVNIVILFIQYARHHFGFKVKGNH